MPPKQTAQHVRCYDVFDTVLTRLVSPPTVIFHLVGEACQEILPSGVSPSQYAALRIQAQRHAQAWHAEATTLDRIFEQMQFLVAWEEEVLRFLKSEEIAMERRWICPVPEIVAGIERWRDEGGAVAFVSDMYLPSHVIEGFLRDHGIYKSQDYLFVSCEHAAKKHDGRLFACVKDSLNPSTVFDQHIGNHAISDVKGARRAGIRGSLMPGANPNRYEAILEDALPSCGIGAAQLAGASRYARLTAPAGTAHDKALRQVAAGVISPLLVCFISWVLNQAKKRSLKRLYFTSRDGQLLHRVARTLAPMQGLPDMDLRYVYFSRASIACAESPSNRLPLHWDTKASTVRGTDLLARAGLSYEDIGQYLQPDFSRSDVDRRADDPGVRTALQSAVEAYAHEHNNNHALEDQRLLRQYLTQEGFMDGTPYGFVDVGWHGTTHTIINRVLANSGQKNTFPGFFFGLGKNQQALASHRQAYFFDRYRQLGVQKKLDSDITTVMEMFCTADHGTVLTYKEVDGCVEPYLEQEWSKRMEDWGLSTIQQTVSRFLNVLEDQPGLVQTEGISLSVLNELLNTFWQDPSDEEARAWGRFPCEIGQAKDSCIELLAPPYQPTDVLYFARYGDHANWLLKENVHALSWTPGRLATSSARVRQSIKLALKIRHAVGRSLQIINPL